MGYDTNKELQDNVQTLSSNQIKHTVDEYNEVSGSYTLNLIDEDILSNSKWLISNDKLINNAVGITEYIRFKIGVLDEIEYKQVLNIQFQLAYTVENNCATVPVITGLGIGRNNSFVYNNPEYYLSESTGVIKCETFNFTVDELNKVLHDDSFELEIIMNGNLSNAKVSFSQLDMVFGIESGFKEESEVIKNRYEVDLEPTVTDITHYYGNSNNINYPPESWDTTPIAPSSTALYLWSRDRIEYSDMTVVCSNPAVIGSYSKDGEKGEKGDKGDKGDTGKGIDTIVNYYALNNDKDTEPEASEWKTTIDTPTATMRYLWNYEEVTYSTGSSSSTPAHIIAEYVKDGKGIQSINEQFKVTETSETPSATEGGWKDTPDELTSTNKYLWCKEVITYTDSSIGTPVIHLQAVYGDTGDTKYVWVKYSDYKDGRDPSTHEPSMSDIPLKYIGMAYNKDISSESDVPEDYTWTLLIGTGVNVVQWYQLSTTTTVPTGKWQSTPPTMDKTNKYLWLYEIVSFTDGTPSIENKGIIGVYGETGIGIKAVSISYAVSKTIVDPTSIKVWETDITKITVNEGEYLYTRTITDYTDSSIPDTVHYSYAKQGEKGSAGEAGENGRDSYVWIAYAETTTIPTEDSDIYADPVGTAENPRNPKWIGIVEKTTIRTGSPKISDGYEWSEYKGADGTDGTVTEIISQDKQENIESDEYTAKYIDEESLINQLKSIVSQNTSLSPLILEKMGPIVIGSFNGVQVIKYNYTGTSTEGEYLHWATIDNSEFHPKRNTHYFCSAYDTRLRLETDGKVYLFCKCNSKTGVPITEYSFAGSFPYMLSTATTQSYIALMSSSITTGKQLKLRLRKAGASPVPDVNIQVKINNMTYTKTTIIDTTDNEAYAYLSINLNAGSYDYSAIVVDNTYWSEVSSGEITVNKANCVLYNGSSAPASSFEVNKGDKLKIKVIHYESSFPPVPYLKCTLTINKVNYDLTTDSNGYIEKTINLNKGTYAGQKVTFDSNRSSTTSQTFTLTVK